MNQEKKNQYILIATIILSLLSVLGISIYLVIKNHTNKSSRIKVVFNQVFVSEYEVDYIDKNYYYEKEDNKLVSFFDSTGKLTYEFNYPINFNNIYTTKDNEYIIFYNENNLLELHIFNGKYVNQLYTNDNAPYVKPIVYKNNDISYTLGFTFSVDNNLYIYNLSSKKLITIENAVLMTDQFYDNTYYTNNNNFLVYKDLHNKQGIIDLNGQIIIKPIYSNINTLPNSTFIVTNEKNKYGIIDSYNNELLPCLYNVVSNYDDYFLVVNNKNKIALYNKELEQLIDFKMDYNPTIEYIYRENTSSINLYKVSDKIIVVNNYQELENKIEYKYHNMYIIKNNEITNTINQTTFNNKNIIYSYNDNIITIYDDNLNTLKELEIPNINKVISFKSINENLIELELEKDKKEIIYYDKEYDIVNNNIGNIIYKTNNYYVVLDEVAETKTITIYDNDNNVLDNISGNNIKTNDEYIIIDNNLYEIMVK